MKFKQLPIVAVTSALMAAPTLGLASDLDEVELDEAFLYFELNDTDGDLGIHGKADDDAWKKMKIEGPEGDNERTILKIRARSGLRRQGLTELFFESAEPTFDELDPEVFFPRFPEGLYEFEGKTLDHEEIEGEVWLSHIIPAAPVVAKVGNKSNNPGFDDEGDKECWEPNATNNGVLITWEAVEQSHFDKWSDPDAEPLQGEEEKIPLGVSGDLEDVLYYEFVAEIDDTDYKSTAIVTPETTQWMISKEFITLAKSVMVEDEDTGNDVPVDEIKFEIIVRVETGEHEYMDDGEMETVDSRPGNQSAVEDCFKI